MTASAAPSALAIVALAETVPASLRWWSTRTLLLKYWGATITLPIVPSIRARDPSATCGWYDINTVPCLWSGRPVCALHVTLARNLRAGGGRR